MKKSFLYCAWVISILGILPLFSVTNYSYSATSSASTQESTDTLRKTKSYVDTLCTSPKFVLLAPIHDKIMQLLADKKYPKYKTLLTDINHYIEETLPWCYDPLYKSNGVAELSLITTQGIEANDWESLRPPSSGYFRRFYHVYYSWKWADPKNPVLLFRIPEESWCLMGVRWRSAYNDMFYSSDAWKTWKRRETENTWCIPATHVKIIPSSKNWLGTEYLGSHFVSLHLWTQVMPNKDLCVDLIYTADNAQYLERNICEKLNSWMTEIDIDGVTNSAGFDFWSKEHVARRSALVTQQGSSQ